MKLNHINLPVSDVAASREFLTKHFGMKVVLDLPKIGLVTLRDEGDMVLNLSHFDKEETEITYHRDFHVGFFLDTREEVDAAHARLTGDGVEVDLPEQQTGRYGFYLRAPGGFLVEVASLVKSFAARTQTHSGEPTRADSTATH